MQRRPVDPKFQVEEVASTNHSSSQKTRLNDLSSGIKIRTALSSVLSQCTRLTDGQTEFSSVDRVCILCSAIKTYVCRLLWSLHACLPQVNRTCRTIFTALHGMQRGKAMRKLSVCLSVKRMNCDKREERSVQIFIPYEKSFSLVFWEEWLVGDPFYLKFCVIWPPLERNSRFWTDIHS